MLRKSPTRTEAFLAANLRNALKSTGPRTAQGKARSCLNALKHGRYAKRLPETLTAAGDRGGAALYQKVREEIGTAFRTPPNEPRETRQLDWLTAKVWCLARRAGVNGRKPRSPVFSQKLGPLSRSLFLFRIKDRRRRIGMVYWVQRKRWWTMERVIQAVGNSYPADAPTLGEALQEKLRHRVYWMRRPGFWERQRYGLDQRGNGAPARADGIRPGQGAAPLEQADGVGDSTPATSDGLGSALMGLLAKLLGGG